MSLKKRIKSIIIISILSVLVVCGYYLVSYFLSNNEIDEYYKFSDDELAVVKEASDIKIYMFKPEFMFYDKTDSKTEIKDSGFSFPSASELGKSLGKKLREKIVRGNLAKDNGVRSDEYETVINGFMESLSDSCDNIKYYHDEHGKYAKKFQIDGNFIVFVKGETIKKVSYDDFFASNNGVRFAFNRTSVINIINSLDGKPQSNSMNLVALSGYDTDGDTVSPITGQPFVFPAITDRKEVSLMKVKNKNGTFKILQDENHNFYFENALTLGYNPEKFSTMLMSGIYMLSNGKVVDPVELSEYGLADEENATAIVEILKTDGNVHKVIIGNKTLDGKNYYAKYYSKDFIYKIDSNIDNSLLLGAGDFLQTSLVNTVSTTEGIYSIDDINVRFLKEDKRLHVVLLDDDDDDGSQVFSIWKILSPEELIPIGKEFGNPNSSAFTEFIQSAANLSSEKIVEFLMTDIPVEGSVISNIPEDALKNYKEKSIKGFTNETLEKYGLLNPRLDVSYSFPYEDNKIVSRVLISDMDKENEGQYYAYSYLYTYDKNGNLTQIKCTGCITTLTLSKIKWLDWQVKDFNNQFLYKNFFYNLDWIEVESEGEIYRFNVDGSSEKEEINSVTLVHNGSSKNIDVSSFKFMYSSILSLYMVDDYEIADQDPNMMCRITIHASGGSTEMIFYRVTNTKAYYTLNGEGKYYVKANAVFNFLSKYKRVIAGEILTRDD